VAMIIGIAGGINGNADNDIARSRETKRSARGTRSGVINLSSIAKGLNQFAIRLLGRDLHSEERCDMEKETRAKGEKSMKTSRTAWRWLIRRGSSEKHFNYALFLSKICSVIAAMSFDFSR